jgi:hypothetical protein
MQFCSGVDIDRMNIVRRSHDHRALCRAGLLFDLLVQLLVLWACSRIA